MARTIEPKTIKILDDTFCNAAYFKELFMLKDIDGVYYRMKQLKVLGTFFGDGQKYYSLQTVLKKLQK